MAWLSMSNITIHWLLAYSGYKLPLLYQHLKILQAWTSLKSNILMAPQFTLTSLTFWFCNTSTVTMSCYLCLCPRNYDKPFSWPPEVFVYFRCVNKQNASGEASLFITILSKSCNINKLWLLTAMVIYEKVQCSGELYCAFSQTERVWRYCKLYFWFTVYLQPPEN